MKRGEIFLAVVSCEERGRLLNETRYPGAPFLPVRRAATGTTFALRFLLRQKGGHPETS